MYYEGDVFYLKKIVFLVSDDIYIWMGKRSKKNINGQTIR